MAEKFEPDQFLELGYTSGVLNEEFLKKWNNTNCIETAFIFVADPLMISILRNRFDMMKFLVDNGADITRNKNLAIRQAAHQGHVDIVKYLLDTFIYSEEYIHRFSGSCYFKEIKKLLDNYKKFSHTKAIR